MINELVLISTLGGVASFGIDGVVIGTVSAAKFVATWALSRPKSTGGSQKVSTS